MYYHSLCRWSAVKTDDLLLNLCKSFKGWNLFQLGRENHKSFFYARINLKQNNDFPNKLNQYTCTESIQPVLAAREQISNPYRNVTNKE